MAGQAEVPPLPESRYDLSTYFGRVRHNIDVTDPRNLLVSRAELQKSQKVLEDYRKGLVPLRDERLWAAKKVVDSTIHPDTGEPIFLPFRMSCFVLTNLFVTAGMLTPGLGTAGTVAWQVVNQSVNVAFNFANANRSTPMNNKDIAKSYALAVGASCSVALGLKRVVDRTSLSPAIKVPLMRLTPFAAVATAGALNVFLMRGQEITHGIDVRTGDGEVCGKSSIAAWKAVSETAVSRVLNSSPIMVIPPLILLRLQRTELLKKRPSLVLPCNLGLILATSLVVLPLAIAAFPQVQSVSASHLEERFHNIKDKHGQTVQTFYFNRGI